MILIQQADLPTILPNCFAALGVGSVSCSCRFNDVPRGIEAPTSTLGGVGFLLLIGLSGPTV